MARTRAATQGPRALSFFIFFLCRFFLSVAPRLWYCLHMENNTMQQTPGMKTFTIQNLKEPDHSLRKAWVPRFNGLLGGIIALKKLQTIQDELENTENLCATSIRKAMKHADTILGETLDSRAQVITEGGEMRAYRFRCEKWTMISH